MRNRLGSAEGIRQLESQLLSTESKYRTKQRHPDQGQSTLGPGIAVFAEHGNHQTYEANTLSEAEALEPGVLRGGSISRASPADLEVPVLEALPANTPVPISSKICFRMTRFCKVSSRVHYRSCSNRRAVQKYLLPRKMILDLNLS